ncbi:MAG: TerB N-terminal domain-containing protein [Oscillospiraceae bacterium]|jgi:hypothetical protein|nr:TerB N-terminal domain-containing protein [Oscillospiraceae bacterium]
MTIDADTIATIQRLMRWSDYKFEQSRFLSNRSDAMDAIREMFVTAMLNLLPLFVSYNITLDTLASGNSYARYGLIEPDDIEDLFALKSLLHDSDESGLAMMMRNFGSVLQRDANRSRATSIPPHAESCIVVGYIVKSLEARLRIIVRHAAKLTPSINKAIKDIVERSYYDSTSLRLDRILDDHRFERLLENAVSLHLERCNKLLLTCPPDDPRLITPLALDIDQENHTEPRASLIRIRSERPRPYAGYAELFYRQARIIDQIDADAIGRSIQLGHPDGDSPQPDADPPELPMADQIGYYKLDDEQLLSYIVWRGSFRSGGSPPASAEAVLLHATELINRVGADNPHDIMAGLARLLRLYDRVNRRIVTHLTAWIRDLYVFNFVKQSPIPGQRRAQHAPPSDPPYGFTMTFMTYIERYGISMYFPALTMDTALPPSRLFAMYASLSTYKIRESKIYTPALIPLLEACFRASLKRVRDMIDDFFVFSKLMVNKRPGDKWRPYVDMLTYEPVALADPNHAAPLRTRLSIDVHRNPEPSEQFTRRKSGWACRSLAVTSAAAPALAAYVIRAMEVHLREVIRFPTKIKLPDSMLGAIRTAMVRDGWNAVHVGEIDSIPIQHAIERAVDDTLLAMYPGGYVFPGAKPAKAAKRDASKDEHAERVPVKVDLSSLDKVRMDADWVFDRLTEDDEEGGVAPIEPIAPPEAFESSVIDPAQSSLSELDSWTGLAAALSDIEKEALSALMDNPKAEGFNVIVRRQGQMPAAFIESINGKALDWIGDTLIEEILEKNAAGYRVIEDYRGDCADICAGRAST